MKTILIVLAVLGAITFNVKANELTLLGLGKLDGQASTEYSLNDIKRVFTSNRPACFKDGSKVVGYNAAYKKVFKTRKACTKKNGERLGVTVITTSQLTAEAFKTLASKGLIKL